MIEHPMKSFWLRSGNFTKISNKIVELNVLHVPHEKMQHNQLTLEFVGFKVGRVLYILPKLYTDLKNKK